MRKRIVPSRVSTLAIAVALVAGPSPALAQFVGSIDSSAGIDTVNSTNGNLIITGQQAVINWTATGTANGGQIVFLPDGNNVSFSSGSDFAVLNRVTPGTAGNAIYMGGNISSFAGDFTGGTVFFYSPNGIVIGQNAVINVGSLGLTTLPISDTNGTWMTGFGTANPQVVFGQATNPNSFIRTNAVIDGSINAHSSPVSSGSYVALVAPIIQHGGLIRTDNAAALVAAEAATITFSPDGLFNIQVTVGTDAATGIDVDGGRIERRDASEALGNNHAAYLVAVAKNDAVDMLIRGGGEIGFDTATSAEVGEGNVVILSGGRNISSGQTGSATGAGPVNLEIDGASFTTNVEADVSGAANINTDNGDTIFDSGSLIIPTRLDLTPGANSIITATNGNRLFVAGDLSASVDKTGTSLSPTGNQLRLTANGAGSELSIGGDAMLTARVFGTGEDSGSNDAVDVTGGTVIVQSGSAGTIDIAGRLDISVDATGGSHAGFNAAAGSATGGTAHILANGGNGSSVTVGGPVAVSASAFAGTIGSDCSADCGITGGNATGGTILLQSMVGTGNQLNLNGTVDLTADGEGGAGDVAAGNGTGGNIQLVAGDAGTITIASDLTIDANGRGGFGVESDTGGGQGGTGTGGYVATNFQNAASTINLNGEGATFRATGSGGDGWAGGGNGTGGWVNLEVGSGGTLNAIALEAYAGASGGGAGFLSSSGGAAGGSAIGGRAWLVAFAGGSADLSSLRLEADGVGGSSTTGAGGAGTGGQVIASANNASLGVRGSTDIQAQGFGGLTSAAAGIGGLGTGGEAQIFADNNGAVTLAGASAQADGQGGHYFSDGATGGNGIGGQVNFRASNGGDLTTTDDVVLTSSGTGGFSFADCSFCGGTGGDGTGGTVTVQANGGATTLLSVGGTFVAAANGQGSGGLAGPGGDGQGGTVRLAVQTGAVANFDSQITLQARGEGGGQFDGLAAGNGTGGFVDAFVGGAGSSLTADGFAELDASGRGGDAEGIGGLAGDGTGGTAWFLGLGGTSTFGGDLVVYAVGSGGDAGAEVPGGTGGDGTGRSARISAVGGDINITGSASVSANGFGGSGVTGGNGTGGGDYFGGMIDGAHLFAQNGDLVIGGAAVAMSDGVGGNGALGGNGGDGSGGWASIHAANGDGGPSSITVQGIEAAAFVSANGVGGGGGDGMTGAAGTSGATGGNGGTGGAGGNGGTGTGGVAAITAAAGNGTLNINFGFVDANGAGGAGGAGGVGGVGGFGGNGAGGNGGAGGVGGAGGSAFGGLASIGVESGTAQAAGLNAGVANFVEAEATASARGGDGGAGGAGGAAGIGSPSGIAGAGGNGGAGGDAIGGIAELQGRGGTVNIFSALLTANATGGNGGAGVVAGAGGDAESDEAYVLVTNRVGNTALRGQLNAGTITGVVTSTGGTGSTPGASLMEGGSGFVVINGDAAIGSVNFNITADDQIPDLAADQIALINADVDIDTGFTFNTDGVVSVFADNATLNTPTFTVSASNFIHDPDRPNGPSVVGVIGADTFNLTTGQDLVLDAHLISTNPLNLIAPGLIDIRDATSGGNLTLQAGSTITGGTQTAGGSVFATAPGNITLGNVVAGNLIDILSTGGDISLGFLSAANSIDLDATGIIGFADVTADAFDFSAGGNVNGGDILAGTQATGEAGGSVTLGNIDVGVELSGGAAEDGFAVGIAAAGPIIVGDVLADEGIGFASLGNLTAGNLDAGTDVMTLIGGNTTIASITTLGGGRVYHGDAQMFLNAGGPDNFDPNHPSFAGDPIRSGGSYTVTGAISTGQLQVGAASISTGDITALNSASLDAAGSVATGAIDTGLLNILAGTNITTGNIFAFDGVTMDAGGAIQTGNIDAGSIDLLAGSDITTGYLNTRLNLQLGGGFTTLLFPGASITLESGGDISTGNISSKDGVYLNAAGSIGTGNIDAIDFVEGHAGTSLATGDIDAGSYVLLTAGTSLAAGAVGASDISAAAGGTATVGGAWSADNVNVTSNDIEIGANGSISAGDISLVSTNATQTVVGDGVAGGGYQLSDAEYDRLHANDINVIADSALGAAPKMLLGDLSVDGSDGEGVNDYEFITGDSESESVEGSIRILGDIVFSNMGESSVGFTTGTFELDAATGLLSLENAPGALGGSLFLNASRIHIASGAILDQLAANPQYEGYQDDLNAPAAVQRPEGVIRARTIDLEFLSPGQGQLNTLYVQNTGTAATPAGFVVSDIGLGDDGEGGIPANSIDLVINGQIVTDTGTLTGIAVRDLLVQGRDLAPFTANSTINGCLLTGDCSGQGPFPPGFTPTPGLPEEFELVDNNHLPPPEFGNENLIDDNIETTIDGATSPIKPPQPLFDTSALGDKGDIDDPVSGSGNPALMETAPAPTCPSGGSQPAGQCKQEKQQ